MSVHSHVVGQGYNEHPERPARCTLQRISVPHSFLPKFSSTAEVTLFYFAKVFKINRWFSRRERFLLISDQVVCLCAPDSGEASWYAPILSIRLLHVCLKELCMGIQLRDQKPQLQPAPPSGSTSASRTFNVVPVDIAFYFPHLKALREVQKLLETIYGCLSPPSTISNASSPPSADTSGALPVLHSENVVDLVGELILRPDGCRQKARRVPLSKRESRNIWAAPLPYDAGHQLCSSSNIRHPQAGDTAASFPMRGVESTATFSRRQVEHRRLPQRHVCTVPEREGEGSRRRKGYSRQPCDPSPERSPYATEERALTSPAPLQHAPASEGRMVVPPARRSGRRRRQRIKRHCPPLTCDDLGCEEGRQATRTPRCTRRRRRRPAPGTTAVSSRRSVDVPPGRQAQSPRPFTAAEPPEPPLPLLHRTTPSVGSSSSSFAPQRQKWAEQRLKSQEDTLLEMVSCSSESSLWSGVWSLTDSI